MPLKIVFLFIAISLIECVRKSVVIVIYVFPYPSLQKNDEMSECIFTCSCMLGLAKGGWTGRVGEWIYLLVG